MRSIGYTTELLEQIKRLVLAMNSVISLLDPEFSQTPAQIQPKNKALILNLHTYKYNENNSEITLKKFIKICEKNDFCDARQISQFIQNYTYSKYKILSVFSRLLKNSACAYENYGMIIPAEYYIKQLLKNPYITYAEFWKAFQIYIKLNKTKCWSNINLVMNSNELKQIESRKKIIEGIISNYISLILGKPIKTTEFNLQQLFNFIQINDKIGNSEILLLIIDYFIRKDNLTKLPTLQAELKKNFEQILPKFTLNSQKSNFLLIPICKALNLEYSKHIKNGFNLLNFNSQAALKPLDLLNSIIKILFKNSVENSISEIKKILQKLSHDLSEIFSTVNGFKQKYNFLTLLYETVEQFDFSKNTENNIKPYKYCVLYVCYFINAKSKFFNIYSLWKLSAILLLRINEILKSDPYYYKIFNIDECTFEWFPLYISIESIGIMHSSRLSHLFIEKQIKKRVSLDFGRQKAYYKFSLQCFKAINSLSNNVISTQKRRSSLENLLKNSELEIAYDFTGILKTYVKNIQSEILDPVFSENYTILILNSNLAEISQDSNKSAVFYMSRIMTDFDPITVKLSEKQCKKLLDEFANLINEFDKALVNNKDPHRYWTECYMLDEKLKICLKDFEQYIFIHFKVFFI